MKIFKLAVLPAFAASLIVAGVAFGQSGCPSGDYSLPGGVNVIVGTSGDDRIFGTCGPDRIRAGAGDDLVRSGAGRDYVQAGTGDDVVVAGSGNDLVIAGSGNDRINVRDGLRDGVNCGPGRDTVLADRRDRVTGNCESVRGN